MPEAVELRLGEEHAIHLPAEGGDWTCDVQGMTSAVEVRGLWSADPYPEDEDEDPADRPPQDVVFMVRAVSPGKATMRFTPSRWSDAREVAVTVTA